MGDFEMSVTVDSPITAVRLPKQPWDITPIEYYAQLLTGVTAMLTSVIGEVSDGDAEVAKDFVDFIANAVKADIMERVDKHDE